MQKIVADWYLSLPWAIPPEDTSTNTLPLMAADEDYGDDIIYSWDGCSQYLVNDAVIPRDQPEKLPYSELGKAIASLVPRNEYELDGIPVSIICFQGVKRLANSSNWEVLCGLLEQAALEIQKAET
jgi:hypothetical protein